MRCDCIVRMVVSSIPYFSIYFNCWLNWMFEFCNGIIFNILCVRKILYTKLIFFVFSSHKYVSNMLYWNSNLIWNIYKIHIRHHHDLFYIGTLTLFIYLLWSSNNSSILSKCKSCAMVENVVKIYFCFSGCCHFCK